MKINFYTLLLLGFILSLFSLAFFIQPEGGEREAGIWGFIDDSVLVFLLISLPFIMVMLAYSLAGKTIRKIFIRRTIKESSSSTEAISLMLNPIFLVLWTYDKLKSYALRVFSIPPLKYIVLISFAAVIIFILSINNFINWEPFTRGASIIRNSIMILGIIAAYNFAMEKGLFSSKNFWKSELMKFGVLIVGAIISLILGNTIALEVDKLTYLDIETSMEHNKNVLIMGFVLSFALANLVNNMTMKRLYG